MRELYTSKVFPKPPCLIAKNYIVAQCTDTPNFIFAIKEGGLGKILQVYNSLIAQLA